MPYYMRGFFWYPAISCIVGIPIFLSVNFFKELKFIGTSINNISLLFHFSFLSLFILKVSFPRNKPGILKIVFLFFIGLITFVLITNDITRQINLAFALSSLGLVFFCIIFYYKLFDNIPIIDLRKEPSFWIITGVFFCMSSLIPISATIDYLKNKIHMTVYATFNLVLMFTYIIMHLFFIKAYLCVAPRQRV